MTENNTSQDNRDSVTAEQPQLPATGHVISLDFVRELMSDLITEIYQVDKWDIYSSGFAFRGTKCPGIEPMQKYNLPMDTFCQGHEAYWCSALKHMDPSFEFKINKAIGRGDTCCEFVVERKNPL